MGTYNTSSGEKVSQSTIDYRVRKAKVLKINQHLEQHGYFFCEQCSRSDIKPIDCSHDISVKACKEQGKTELAWSVENITLRCRKCHNELDKLSVKWTHN